MADGLGCYVHAVVMGQGVQDVAQELIAAGADRVTLPTIRRWRAPTRDARCWLICWPLSRRGALVRRDAPGRRRGSAIGAAVQHGVAGALHQLADGRDGTCAHRQHPVYAATITRWRGHHSTDDRHGRAEHLRPPYLDPYRFGETETVVVDLSGQESRVREWGLWSTSRLWSHSAKPGASFPLDGRRATSSVPGNWRTCSARRWQRARGNGRRLDRG